MHEADFQFVAREVRERTGAALSPEIANVAETRLIPLARREGFDTVSELVATARTRGDGKLAGQIADALLIADTRFFRDRQMFQRLRAEILPKLAERRGAALRIWCAGCATGQEAYSLAMLVDELREEGRMIGAEIVGSDLSPRLLDKARAGLYTQFEVQRGLPIRKLIAHFEKAGDLWRISDRLRARVRYEQHNLLTHPEALGRFDAILCCNVLPGFDEPTRTATLARLADALEPSGALILGAGETLPGECDGFDATDGVYVKSAIARAAA